VELNAPGMFSKVQRHLIILLIGVIILIEIKLTEVSFLALG